eukprot:s860_g6.t1
MPYPEVFTKGAAARLPDVHFKRLVNLQVMTLSWYHLGCPSVAPQCLVLGARLSAKQWTVIRNLEFLARDRNFTEFVSAADMGRSASKVEDLQDCMDVLGRAAAQLHDFDGCYAPLKPSKESVFDEDSLSAGTVVGRVQHDPVVTAKPIEADRLVFPGPPSFDPRPFMDADTVQRYDFPLQTSLIHEGDLEEPPQVTIRATRENKLKLYKKLYETGRLQPLKADTFFAKYPSGLFAVGKDQHRDRMILDGRPANVADRPQRKWARALASGSTLSQLHLLPEYDLCVSGEDLKDYFYQFKVGSERVRRNVLCGPVDLCDAHAVFGDSFEWSEDPIYVGLSTLAMGDVNAVEFAQSSHLGLCFHFGVANPDEVLTLQGAIPRGLLQVGIIVDDLIILEQVLKSMRVKPDAPVTTADERIDRALHAYRSVGLEHNPKKEFRNETLARFWGLEVDGQKGLLRSSSLRLWPLCLITMRVVRLGLATVGLLESLAGSWVSIFSIRRKLFCILDLVFEPLGIPDQKKVIRLSPELVSELCSLVIMGTLAVVNLRADFMDKVMATDASEKWMAGVSAYCPRNIVKEVSRYSLRKAVWTKLLTPLRARDRSLGILSPEDELPDDHYETHPLWVLLARCLQYGNSWREQVRRHTHINILELRAHLRQVRRLSTSTSSVRALHGLDSQVSLGCLIKGRSSSSSLNSEMQKSMCFSVGSDLYDNYMYFPSADNPSDGPSRESDVPAPTMPLPPWWHDLSEGDSQSFDSWMAAFDMDIFLGGVDFSELCHGKDVDICTGAFMKRKDFLKKLASHRAPGAALDRPKKSGNCSHSSSASQGRKVRAGHGSVLPPEACDLLLSFDDKQFFFEGDFLMLDRPGGLDLFSGRCGVAREMVRQGAPWVLTFDWNRSSAEDLLNPDLRDKLVTLFKLQAFKTFGAAPICSSFSVAVTPAVRSTQYPRGLPGMRATMRQKVREGNSHSDWLIELVELCDAMGVIWWVENPGRVGARCESCAQDYYPPGECSRRCSRSNCIQGSCNQEGFCDCRLNWFGPTCSVTAQKAVTTAEKAMAHAFAKRAMTVRPAPTRQSSTPQSGVCVKGRRAQGFASSPRAENAEMLLALWGHSKLQDSGMLQVTRLVRCYNTGSGALLEDSQCAGEKPLEREACVTALCSCTEPPRINYSNYEETLLRCPYLQNGKECYAVCDTGYARTGVYKCESSRYVQWPICLPIGEIAQDGSNGGIDLALVVNVSSWYASIQASLKQVLADSVVPSGTGETAIV